MAANGDRDDGHLAAEGVCVLPAERLTPEGLDASFATWLVDRGVFDRAWIEQFDRALRTFRERSGELVARAPAHWFPPRLQNVCIVTDPDRVRPFFQPFYKASWLLYASDFDPRTSNVEFAVYQLLLVERTGIMQQVFAAWACNLSYWLTRTDAQVESFCEVARASTRPDAALSRALAEALPEVRRWHHDELKPLANPTGEPEVTLPGTGLRIPQARAPWMKRMVQTVQRGLEGVVESHYARFALRDRNHAQDLCRWFAEARPRALVTGRDRRIVWDWRKPDEVKALQGALHGITKRAEASVKADLEVIGERTSAFLDSLTDESSLPQPNPASADQDGLCYMHAHEREIAYCLFEPTAQRLREPAPPFERSMLAARCVHEWGHLAVEAGWVPVDPERRSEYDEQVQALGRLFQTIHDATPEAVRSRCAPSLRKVVAEFATNDLGEALARLALSRMEDFQSNLLSRRYLTPCERDTYVRNNVRSLVHDYPPEAVFQRLARYAYDFQYLRFSEVDDAEAYFLRTTWFEEQYLANGLLSREHYAELFGLVRSICDLYIVDTSAVR